ncbi:MAG TPA: hypothetical protein VKH37_13585, partial [Ferruginibacter sp.]|nr:hypothetical protein [Ferruginibacter sp.]
MIRKSVFLLYGCLLGFASVAQQVSDSAYNAAKQQQQVLVRTKTDLSNRLAELKKTEQAAIKFIDSTPDSILFYQNKREAIESQKLTIAESIPRVQEDIEAAKQKHTALEKNVEGLKAEIKALEDPNAVNEQVDKSKVALDADIAKERADSMELRKQINNVISQRKADEQSSSKAKDIIARNAVLRINYFKLKANDLFQKPYNAAELNALLKEADDIINSPDFAQDQKDKITGYINSMKGYCGILNEVADVIDQANRGKRQEASAKLLEEAKSFDKIFGYVISELT